MRGAPGHASNAPVWLFSFVDLAFLLLIAMTQLGSRDVLPDLGEILVPRLASEADAELPVDAPERWQLRVHPPAAGEASAPFELVAGAAEAGQRLDRDALRQALAGIDAARGPKPLLAPHRDSRSEDLLTAAGLLEDLWPERRRATFAPLAAN